MRRAARQLRDFRDEGCVVVAPIDNDLVSMHRRLLLDHNERSLGALAGLDRAYACHSRSMP